MSGSLLSSVAQSELLNQQWLDMLIETAGTASYDYYLVANPNVIDG